MQRMLFNFGWERALGKVLPWEKNENQVAVNLPDDFVLNLPRSAEAVGGARVGYTGDHYATYTKLFAKDPAWEGKRVLLYLDGAYMYTEVVLNKDRIGMHPYGYTPYKLDLTDKLRADLDNELVITTQTMQPSSRWYSGGGLYRGAELWIGEPVYLDPWDLRVTTPVAETKRGAVHVQADVTNTLPENKTAKVKVTLSFDGGKAAEAEQTVIAAAGGKTAFDLLLLVDNPMLWDDETPNLYDLTIAVQAENGAEDVTRKKIGIRQITISADEGMRINGRPVTLFGGCIHHDNGILGARALPRAEERKIRNLKAAGFNAIRTAHNPPSDALLDACDRLGVLVIDEFFDCWRTGKNQNDYHLWFEDWWKRDIEYTMRRDRNHPSVYCWSFGNEIQEANGYSNGEYWMKEMADFIRSLDASRLVTCGGMFLPKDMTCDGFPGGPGGPPARVDPYASVEETNRRWISMISNLDIVSLNYSFRNYAQFHKLFPDKVLQGTETQGIDAWGNREAVRANPHVVGDFMWTAHDNLGEAGAGRAYWEEPVKFTGLMGSWPWLSCYQGDLALDGERLPRSYYRKVIWGKDQGLYLFTNHPENVGKKVMGTGFHWHDVRKVWTYPAQYVGKPVDVEAYGDADKVEFYVNGVLMATAQPEEMIFYATVPYEPGTLEAIAYKDGRKVAEDRIETTGPAAQVVLEADGTELIADGMELAYVTATLTDAEGRRVYDADVELTADVEGAAVLEGFGSNNPCTAEDFGTGRRFTWNGRATLVLRASLESGAVKVTVKTETLPEASMTLRVR